METLLLIGGIATVALFLFRPTPQPQIIYMPIEMPSQRRGLGCVPLIVVGVLVLLVLLASGGIQI